MQAADHEGVLGRQGEAVTVQGAVGSIIWVWGVTGCGALEGFLLASVSATARSEKTDFQASYKFLGHSGSLVSEEPVVEHLVEDTDGVSIIMGVGYCGLGQVDDMLQVE
jgi:hypothetical protein